MSTFATSMDISSCGGDHCGRREFVSNTGVEYHQLRLLNDVKEEEIHFLDVVKREEQDGDAENADIFRCKGDDHCFVCERAFLQALPENLNWKRRVQKSIMNQLNWKPDCGRSTSFTVESLRKLTPAEPPKPASCYIFDEKLGRKRRHDPWFANHKLEHMPQEDKKEPKKVTKTSRSKKKILHRKSSKPVVDEEMSSPITDTLPRTEIAVDGPMLQEFAKAFTSQMIAGGFVEDEQPKRAFEDSLQDWVLSVLE